MNNDEWLNDLIQGGDNFSVGLDGRLWALDNGVWVEAGTVTYVPDAQAQLVQGPQTPEGPAGGGGGGGGAGQGNMAPKMCGLYPCGQTDIANQCAVTALTALLPDPVGLVDNAVDVAHKTADFLKNPGLVGLAATQVGMSIRNVSGAIEAAAKTGTFLGKFATIVAVASGAWEYQKALGECLDRAGYASAKKF